MPDDVTFVVYNPPTPGLPFLAVMITPDGEVTATPYDTATEAEAYNRHFAAELHSKLQGDHDA
jgi:L-2-hydroxyglutarate oxidase LhgO